MRKWYLTYTLSGSFLLFSLLYFLINGFNQETNQVLIRLSARTSFIVFCIAFSASIVYKISKNKYSKFTISNRKYLGVTFAMIHLFHFGLITIKDVFFEPVFITRGLKSLLPGIITYLFIALMLLTSFSIFSKKITPKQWSIIHTIGGYLILFIFTISYSSRVQSGKLFYFPLFIIAISVWFLRLFNKLKYGTRNT